MREYLKYFGSSESLETDPLVFIKSGVLHITIVGLFTLARLKSENKYEEYNKYVEAIVEHERLHQTGLDHEAALEFDPEGRSLIEGISGLLGGFFNEI